MPTVDRYRDETRGVWRWRGRYFDATGSRRSRTFDTRAAAKRWAAAEEDKVARGQRSDPVAAKMRWGVWCDRWLAAKPIEPRSLRTLESTVRAHVRPRWGEVALLGITRLDVQAWVNTIARKRSASTTRKALYALSNSLQVAVVEGILTANPCVGIVVPTVPTGQERYLTDVEAGRILYHLDGRWRVLAELMLGTGLRLSEATGLHRARVDLDGQRLQVIETYDPAVKPSGEMRGYPKSKRRRAVPLSPELAELLAQHLALRPPLPTCERPHRAGRCPGGLVFRGERDAPIDGHNFASRQWRQACELAGLPGVHLHDLRHTYASRLVQQGVPLERVQLLLGHADLSTSQIYAHLVPTDDWDEVRAALSTSVTAARCAAAAAGRDAESGRADHADGHADGQTDHRTSLEPTGHRRRMRVV